MVSKKPLPNPKLERLFPVFYSNGFVVLALALKFQSVVHLELIFVCGMKERPSFIILLVDVQLSLNHLSKILFFFPLLIVENKVSLCSVADESIQDDFHFRKLEEKEMFLGF